MCFFAFLGCFGTKKRLATLDRLYEIYFFINERQPGADGQQQLFDEVPVRLVLLAPFKGGNVRTKERWGDLSNAGRHPAQKKKRPRGANRRRKLDGDVTYMSVMVAKWSRV